LLVERETEKISKHVNQLYKEGSELMIDWYLINIINLLGVHRHTQDVPYNILEQEFRIEKGVGGGRGRCEGKGR